MSLGRLIEDIGEKLVTGEVVLVIGAGASLRPDGPCPPTGSALRRLIAKEIEYSSNGRMPLGNIPLSTVAQHYEVCEGRDGLRTLLLREIGDKAIRPSAVHEGIAKITTKIPRIDLIITTNYDGLMEAALKRAEKDYDVLVQFPDRPNDDLYYEFRDDAVALYKMHGSFDELGRPEERDSLVITDDDYIELLANVRAFVPLNILTRLANRHLLFLGYSLQDWDFMVLFKSVVESKNRGKIKRSYVIQKPLERDGEDTKYWQRYFENTKSYWKKKNIQTLEILQDEFMAQLLKQLQIEE